jgi:hypothetical protein
MKKVSWLALSGTLFWASAPLAQQPAGTKQAASIDCKAIASANVDHARMDHTAHDAIQAACNGPLPTMAGNAAFGAIGEIVRLLQANPNTDWTKVNLEALRLHLIDMDDVIMRSTVRQKPVDGGLEIEVTGTGKTALAIRRMAVSHTRSLDQGAVYRASATELPGGARLTITAKDRSNALLVATIRGLGFAGLMTEGDHHVRHHLALARGDAAPHR